MTTTRIDAEDLTLLVAEHPDARAYQANPIDLADRTEAHQTLTALRADGETVLVGIEFDDPTELGNRIVLAGADLYTVEFIGNRSRTIPVAHVLGSIDALACAILQPH